MKVYEAFENHIYFSALNKFIVVNLRQIIIVKNERLFKFNFFYYCIILNNLPNFFQFLQLNFGY